MYTIYRDGLHVACVPKLDLVTEYVSIETGETPDWEFETKLDPNELDFYDWYDRDGIRWEVGIPYRLKL